MENYLKIFFENFIQSRKKSSGVLQPESSAGSAFERSNKLISCSNLKCKASLDNGKLLVYVNEGGNDDEDNGAYITVLQKNKI